MSLEARAVAPAEPDPDPEPDPGPDPDSGPEPEPRPALEPAPGPDPVGHSIAPRRPRTVGGVVFLLVLAATLGGVGVVAVSDWQAGLTLTGAALLAAATMRLVLPASQAGMLGVRRKLVDVATLLVLGGGLVALAALIPPRLPS